jgi:4-hydroxybenzoyl-CoA thioesterase
MFLNPKLIRFRHCDPAGIVYYPRYYELLHETQEDFLAHIGFPEPALIRSGIGVPIVAMETQFSGMSRNGDEVVVALDLWKLGGSSIGMRYVVHAAGNASDIRLRAKSTVVISSTSHDANAPAKALRIPDDLRAALQPYLHQEPAP